MTATRRRRGTLTEADRTAWAQYAATVPPLPGRAVPPLEPPSLAPAPIVPPVSPDAAIGAAPAAPAQSPASRASVMAQAMPLAVGDMPGGVDRASWRRLTSGRLQAERWLDLHGHTLDQAQAALVRFLGAARAENVRCVEIITGRGGLRGEGAIKRELPHWLNLPALRPLVLAAAYPHQANQGAVRLLLRRAGGR